MNKKHYAPEGFGDRLYDAFMHSEKTVTEIANATGISRSSVYAYIYNNVPPNISNFAALCSALHVSADWLLFGA